MIYVFGDLIRDEQKDELQQDLTDIKNKILQYKIKINIQPPNSILGHFKRPGNPLTKFTQGEKICINKSEEAII